MLTIASVLWRFSCSSVSSIENTMRREKEEEERFEFDFKN